MVGGAALGRLNRGGRMGLGLTLLLLALLLWVAIPREPRGKTAREAKSGQGQAHHEQPQPLD